MSHSHYNEKVWNPVLNIPEGSVNDYAVRHIIKPPGTEMTTTFSLRNQFFGKQKTVCLNFEMETLWHELSHSGGVWMTDLPCEQAQIDRLLPNLRGRVLVGGLGLGYAVSRLQDSELVDEIVVVEKAPEVIELVAEHVVDDSVTCVHQGDLFDYLQAAASSDSQPPLFDSAFYDIWKRDSESTFHEIVVPLRQLSIGVIAESVECWNEDVMRGQLSMGLQSKMMLVSEGTSEEKKEWHADLDLFCTEDPKNVWIHWSVPFFRDLRDGRFTPLETEWAEEYARIYGLAGWKERWKQICL